MSHTFRARILPSDPEALATALRAEIARLQQALNEAQPSFTYQVLHAAPDKTWAGMVIYADGADWNPGAGEGLYIRNAANAAWVPYGPGRTWATV